MTSTQPARFRRERIYALLTGLVFLLGAYAAVLVRPTPQIQIVAPGTTGGAELAAASAQLELLQQQSNRMTELVAWSLGVVLSISVGLAAFSWFTNKTQIDRDRENLSRELVAMVQAQTASMKAAIEADVGATFKKLSKESATALTNAIDARLSPLKESIDDLNEELTDIQFEKLAGEIRDRLEIAARNPNAYLGSMTYDLTKAMKFALRVRYYNAPAVGTVLDLTHVFLSNPNVRIPPSDVGPLQAMLERVTKEHQAAAKKLVERLHQRAALSES